MKARLAGSGDMERVVELWRELMAVHQPLEQELYAVELHSSQTYGAWVRRNVNGGDGFVGVVPVGGEIAGYILAARGLRAPIFKVREVGMIFDLVVAREHRRKGVGRLLVEFARQRFSNMGIGFLQVNFDVSNAQASVFWAALGFQTRLAEAYSRQK